MSWWQSIKWLWCCIVVSSQPCHSLSFLSTLFGCFLGLPSLHGFNFYKMFFLICIYMCCKRKAEGLLMIKSEPSLGIIDFSRDEAESMGLSLHHRRKIGGLFVFSRLLSGLAPSALSVLCPPEVSAGLTRSTINPFLMKPPKSRITAHLHSFVTPFPHLWNQLPHSLQSNSALQVFKTAVQHHLRSPPIQNHDIFCPC